jgi:hypothetical protein
MLSFLEPTIQLDFVTVLLCIVISIFDRRRTQKEACSAPLRWDWEKKPLLHSKPIMR